MVKTEMLGIYALNGNGLSRELKNPDNKVYYLFVMREDINAALYVLMSISTAIIHLVAVVISAIIGDGQTTPAIVSERNMSDIATLIVLIALPPIIMFINVPLSSRLILYNGEEALCIKHPGINHYDAMQHKFDEFIKMPNHKFRRFWIPFDRWRFDRIIRSWNLND